MEDIAEEVATSQHFSIEFDDRGTKRLMFVRFWKGPHFGLPTTGLTGELGPLYRWLLVGSIRADIVASSS